MEKCFVKAWSSILEFLSNFLLWFPISGQTQLPTSWSIWSISFVGAKISLKRKSGPFGVWMGGNGWRVYPPCQSFNNNTRSLLLCTQVKYQSLFSLRGFDLLPWFETVSETLCGKFSDLSLSPPLLSENRAWSGPGPRLVGTAAQMIWALCRFHDSFSESTPPTWDSTSMQSWFTGRFVNLNDYSIWCVLHK